MFDSKGSFPGTRELLSRISGIRCVFPEFSDCGSDCRVMLEQCDARNSSTSKPKFIEELLCTVFSGNLPEERMRILYGDGIRDRALVKYGEPCTESKTRQLAQLTHADALRVHPGISPIYGILEHPEAVLAVHDYAKHTLLSLSRFHVNTSIAVPSFGRLEGDAAKDIRLRFVVYQLLQVLCYVHEQGFSLGAGMHPRNVMIDDDMWVTVSALPSSGVALFDNIERPPGYRDTLTARWVRGQVSNMDYLMAVNAAAGRSMIDSLYHPVLPWITDFSCACPLPGCGLRNFSMTKFRLSKGDHQLATSFAHSEPPHHISESLSELTYCIYLARVMPMQVLKRVVRSDFVPEHYPHSIARMFEWSPDECIPEFFCDPSCFRSIHRDVGLMDLSLPSFAPTPEEFVKFHRTLLESDVVSAHLHDWIDLTFGCCLEGRLAEKNMNVPLRHRTSAREKACASPDLAKHPGFVVLFRTPHPARTFPCETRRDLCVDMEATSVMTGTLSHANSTDSASRSSSHKLSSSGSGKSRLERTDRMPVAAPAVTSAWMANLQHSGAPDIVDELTLALSTYSDMMNSRSSKQRGSLSQPASGRIPSQRVMGACPAGSQTSAQVRGFVEHAAFHERYRALLEPAYWPAVAPTAAPHHHLSNVKSGGSSEPNTSPPVSDSAVGSPDFLHADGEFSHAVSELRDHVATLPPPVDGEGTLALEQAADMHALGCIIAEFYCGEPLLHPRDVMTLSRGDSHSKSVRAAGLVAQRAGRLPIVLRQLIALLIDESARVRPTPRDVLENTVSGGRGGYIDFASPSVAAHLSPRPTSTEEQRGTGALPRSQSVHGVLLGYFCGNVFPEYFKTAYQSIGSLKLKTTVMEKLQVAAGLLPVIMTTPLEGLGIILPHILSAVSIAPTPLLMTSTDDGVDEMACTQAVGQYVALVDALGSRLGPELFCTCVVPAVVDYVASIRHASMAVAVINSKLWQVIMLRAGPVAFLRYFLPTLLTYLMLGTLKHMTTAARDGVMAGGTVFVDEGAPGVATLQSGGTSTESGDTRTNIRDAAASGNVGPLWASGQGSEPNDWLLTLSGVDLVEIQAAAARVIPTLASPQLLGPGLACRYVLPALLCLVGSPKVAIVSEFEQRAAPDSANERDDTATTYEPQHMFIVPATVDLALRMGEVVTCEVVLKKIFEGTLPAVVSAFDHEQDYMVSAKGCVALMEVIFLLSSLLPTLQASSVVNYFLKPARRSCLSLPALLHRLPMHTSMAVEGGDWHAMQLQARWQRVRLNFCRLLTSACMIAGARVAFELVIPAVDVFFGAFVAHYGATPVTEKGFLDGIEVGAQLYTTLGQLVGMSAMEERLTHTNPALVMWLRCEGSGGDRRELPQSVLPDTLSPKLESPLVKSKGKGMWKQTKAYLKAMLANDPTNASGDGKSKGSAAFQSPDSLALENMKRHVETAKKDKQRRVDGAKHGDDGAGSGSPDRRGRVEGTPIQRARSKSWMDVPDDRSDVIDMLVTAEGGDGEFIQLEVLRTGHKMRPQPENNNSTKGDAAERGADVQCEGRTKSKEKEGGDVGSPDDSRAEAESDAPQRSPLPIPQPDFSLVEGEEAALMEENPVQRTQQTPQPEPRPPPPPPAVPAPPQLAKPVSPATASSPPLTLQILPSTYLSRMLDRAGTPGSGSKVEIRSSGKHLRPHDKSMTSQLREFMGSVQKGGSPVKDGGELEKAVCSSVWLLSGRGRWLDASPRESTVWNVLRASGNSEGGRSHDATMEREDMSDSIACGADGFPVTPTLAGDRSAAAITGHSSVSGAGMSTTVGGGAAGTAGAAALARNNPAAYLSMTSPRIVCDVAAEATCYSHLSMRVASSLAMSPAAPVRRDSTGGSGSGTMPKEAISFVGANASESLLLIASQNPQQGLRLASITTDPIATLSRYTQHDAAVTYASFLRCGNRMLSSDGTLHIWDIETSQRLHQFSTRAAYRDPFRCAAACASTQGFAWSVQSSGDDVLVASTDHLVTHVDIRVARMHVVAEWQLPPTTTASAPITPSDGESSILSGGGGNLSSTGMSSSIVLGTGATCITAILSQGAYLLAGTAMGGLWVMDRRTGLAVTCVAAHESSVIRLSSPRADTIVSISERSGATVWNFDGSRLRLVNSVRGLPDAGGPLTANTVFAHDFEEHNAFSYHHHEHASHRQRSNLVLYAFSGHKHTIARVLSSQQSSGAKSRYDGATSMEMTLSPTHFRNRYDTKLNRKDIHVSASCLLPLRRILLLGDEDGTLKTVI